MLTSKEIIERTGISRATLNNYIASGLVPRPEVLPPGPEHGDAPRIGYFPDDTIDRVETIQRLKREGWSITRIAEHFARGGAAAPAMPTGPIARPPVAAQPRPAPEARSAVFDGDPTLSMFVGDVRYPAYLVDDRFHVMWMNDPARQSALSPLAGRPGGETDNVFRHLLELQESDGRDALLRFHLAAAKDRAHRPEDLFRDITSEQANRLQETYASVQRPDAGLVTQARLPPTARQPARAVYAVHFRHAVLFAFGPATGAVQPSPQPRAPEASPPAPVAPVNAPVAVLVATLQDASSLWVKLTAQEYFELLNEVWTELEQIFRRHAGRPGRQPGEVLVWYFPSQGDASYLWDALAAAQQARDAMRRLSRRWQVRKGWDVELCMNMGVDEGREWLGAVGAQVDVRVLGEAADRAEQLSRSSRGGAILSTRSLLGKLPALERQRLTYGVPRRDGSGARVLFTFDRLQDLAAGSPVPPRLADVAVAEVLDLNLPAPAAPGGAS